MASKYIHWHSTIKFLGKGEAQFAALPDNYDCHACAINIRKDRSWKLCYPDDRSRKLRLESDAS